MLLRLLLLSLSLGLTLAGQAEIYKYRGEYGEVTYSDQPKEGGEQVDLPNANTTPAVEPQERSDEDSTEPFDGYQITIASPKDEAIITNGLSPTTVKVNLDPALREGDEVRLILDGQVFEEKAGTNFTIPQLNRGSHTLQAEAVTEDGSPAGQSGSVGIFVYWPGGN